MFALLHLGWAACAPFPATELCCCPQVQHGADVLLAPSKCALIHADSHGTTRCTGAAEKGSLGLVKAVPWVDESRGSCQETGASISSVHPILLRLCSPAALLFSFCFFPVFQPKLIYPKVQQEVCWKMLKDFCIPIQVQQRSCLLCTCQRSSAS